MEVENIRKFFKEHPLHAISKKKVAETGEIIKNKPYLIECDIKITQLELEDINDNSD